MIKDLITEKYTDMSASQQRIARFIVEHPEDVIFKPIAELSAVIGVSAATIVRFSNFIGFSGFADLKRALQQDALKDETASQVTGAERENTLINRFYAGFDEKQMKDLAEKIMNAKNILLIGYLQSFSTAAELLHILSLIRERVLFTRLLYGDDEAMSMYLEDEYEKDTLVIAVSFAPHYRYTQRLLKRAKNGGRQVVLLTDSRLNVMTEYADDVVVIPTRRGEDGMMVNVSAASEYCWLLGTYIRDHYRDRMRDQTNTINSFIEDY